MIQRTSKDLQASAFKLMVPKDERITPKMQRRITVVLSDLMQRHGAVIRAYPFWHPMLGQYGMRYLAEKDVPYTPRPQWMTAVVGKFSDKLMEHAVYFRNAFIACPYENPDKYIEFLNSYRHPFGHFNARRLHIEFCDIYTLPFIVEWVWSKNYGNDNNIIHHSLAAKLMMHSLIPAIIDGMDCRPINEMREALLGEPCSTLESVFIDRDGTRSLKRIWAAMHESEGLLLPDRAAGAGNKR